MPKKLALLGTAIFIASFVFSVIALNRYFQLDNRLALDQLVKESGIWGPFFIILLQAIQVILVPIPGQITGIISGYFFGSFWGTIYSMVGLTLGSFLAFLLARKLGAPFVKNFVPKKILDKFSFVTEDAGLFAIFLIFLFPLFPDDAICFLCGLTKIKIRLLVLISFLGRLPGCVAANLFGAGVASSKIQYSLYLAMLLLVATFFVYRNKKKIESYIKRTA